MRSACIGARRRSLGWGGLWAALLVVAGARVPAWAQAGTSRADSEAQSVEALFDDYLHFARLGKFPEADGKAEQLLKHPDLNPAELVSIADRDPRSLETLMLIIRSSTVGENATRVLEVLREGETILRRDPERIRKNIEKLGGPPQMEHNATEHLINSGEYAVPWMLNALADPAQQELHQRIMNALPKIGGAAVRPLVAGLETEDEGLRGQIVRALGEIGYDQAVPYLQKMTLDSRANPATLAAVEVGLQQIAARAARPLPPSAAEAFLRLAEQYYDGTAPLAADLREPQANVWRWSPETRFVEATPVPQRIFGQVMAMRCCEESLRIDPGGDQAIALWLAANIRREARLGMDVESAAAAEPTEPDATRPNEFPRSLYFTQAAGPRYAHLVLARAVKDGDAEVALGAIAALRQTAGAASLVGAEDFKQPLVQALQFPNALVRVRAALALANALPTSDFRGSALVVPVLAEALTRTGADRFVVADPDQTNLNRLAAALRQGGAAVVAEDNFYKAMDRARRELDNVTAFVLATDLKSPDLAAAVQTLQAEFVYAHAPVIVLVKAGGVRTAEELAAAYQVVARTDAAAGRDELMSLLADRRKARGEPEIGGELAASLALEAATALYRIAADGRTVFDHAVAEPAVIAGLASGEEELRRACLSGLALIGTPNAQQAVADAALDDANNEPLRLAAFDSLASSAKAYGNRLDGGRVTRLLNLARDGADPTVRSAAAKALGALNLSDNQASDIIRSYYRG